MTTTLTQITTARGAAATIHTREGTSDLSLAGAFFRLWGKIDDEYHLSDLRVSGTIVDIGAHIGLVSLAILLDNPHTRAICVEPLAENVALIHANMIENGVADRVTVLQGAIGPGSEATIQYGLADDSEMHVERFIGGLQSAKATNTSSVTVPTYTLASLVDMAGGDIALLKIDCEGCEWDALADKAVKYVRTIVGEWHGHPLGVSPDGFGTLATLLDKTHDIGPLDDKGGTGTFLATRRTVSPRRAA